MASKNWWYKFEHGAWRNDICLRRCSMSTQGVWINVICVMREAETSELSGTVEELARVVGCMQSEIDLAIAELERTGTADVLRDVTNGNEIVTLVSRRLKKELSTKESTRLRVQKHRSNENVTAEYAPRVRVRDKSKNKTLTEPTLSVPGRTPLGPPSARGETRARERAAPPPKGTRLRDDFTPDAKAIEWAYSNHPEVDVPIETEKFVNHFTSATGQTAVKLDWTAAWRNWIMRSKKDYAKPRQMGSQKKAGLADKLDDIKDMLGTYR